MIVRCPDCRSKYEIAGEHLPDADFKLRCPKCKAVFPVSGAVPAEASPETGPVGSAPAGSPPAGNARAGGATAGVPPTVPLPVADPEPVPARPPRPRVTDPDLARRMARALVSEMVLNRRAERDEALEREAVLQEFGKAIAEAFQEYRARVSPDLQPADRIFREAVNEILGEGAPLL